MLRVKFIEPTIALGKPCAVDEEVELEDREARTLVAANKAVFTDPDVIKAEEAKKYPPVGPPMKGEKGEKGDQGDTGRTGAKGEKGEVGSSAYATDVSLNRTGKL